MKKTSLLILSSLLLMSSYAFAETAQIDENIPLVIYCSDTGEVLTPRSVMYTDGVLMAEEVSVDGSVSIVKVEGQDCVMSPNYIVAPNPSIGIINY